MQRVDTSTAAAAMPAFAPLGTPGFFSNGNASLGQRGTVPGEDWFNAVQEEIISALTAAGITPNKNNLAQLRDAILGCGTVTDVGVTPGTLVANPTPPIASLYRGFRLFVVPAAACPGASTLNVSGGGPMALLRPDGTPTQQSDYAAGAPFGIWYTGTTWRMTAWPAQRIRLNANLLLYVSNSGSDSNSGLSSGAAFATLSKAWNYIQSTLDLNGYAVTVTIANGTYAPLAANGALVGATLGAGSVLFFGNIGSPGLVAINGTGANAIGAANGAVFTVRGVQLASTASGGNGGYDLIASNGAQIAFSSVNFAAATTAHCFASTGATIAAEAGGSYTIIAGSGYHALANAVGTMNLAGATVTLTGTPAFSVAFAGSSDNGMFEAYSMTFSGSATGIRYLTSNGGGIDTNGGGASYFPGNAGGTASSPGFYV